MSAAENINTNPTYFIKRVKDTSFFVNEKLFIADPSKPIKIELQHLLGVNVEKDLIEFTLRIFLHYQDAPKSIDNLLADIRVQNVFEVENLKKYEIDNNLALPNSLLIAIVSMSISHGRALLAKNLAGTAYQEVILPITNPLEVAASFFPNISKEQFEKEQNNDETVQKSKKVK